MAGLSSSARRRVGALVGILAIAALSTVLLRKRNEGLLSQAGRRTAEAQELFAGAYVREGVQLGCDALAPGRVGGPAGIAVVVRVTDYRRLSLVGERCEAAECMPKVAQASVDYRLPDLGAVHQLPPMLEALAAGGFAVPYVDDGAGPHAGQDEFEASVATAAGERCVSLRRETRVRVDGETLILERTLRVSDPAETCAPLPADAPCHLRIVERFQRQPRPADAGASGS